MRGIIIFNRYVSRIRTQQYYCKPCTYIVNVSVLTELEKQQKQQKGVHFISRILIQSLRSQMRTYYAGSFMVFTEFRSDERTGTKKRMIKASEENT